QHLDLRQRALPAFGGKSVEGECANAEVRAIFDDGTDPVHARSVTGEAGKAAPLGPSPVTIHDDGDVRRDTCGVDGKRQSPVISFRIQGVEKTHRVKRPWYTVAQSSGDYKVPGTGSTRAILKVFG